MGPGPSGKLPSGLKELNRAGSSLRTFFLERKSSQMSYVKKIVHGMQETSLGQKGPPGQAEGSARTVEPEMCVLG